MEKRKDQGGAEDAEPVPLLTEAQVLELTQRGDLSKIWQEQEEHGQRFKEKHRPTRRLLEKRINYRP